MKLRPAENSLFAILWRSSWWISGAIALGVMALAKVFLPEPYVPYGLFSALPFAAIALAAAWKQLRQPSAARIAKALDALRAMSAEEFLAAVADAYRRQGYEVTRLAGAGADFELTRAGRIALVGAKRWKAARTGVEPLRELRAAARAREAQECIYLAAGEISDQAQAYASGEQVRLVRGAELAMLLART